MAPGSKENRDLFINILKTHNMVAVNTKFQKDNSKLVTYSEKVELEQDEATNGPPYDFTKYAQCDCIITNKENISMFKDCENDLSNRVNSDHFPLIASIVVKSKYEQKKEHIKAESYFKPDSEKWNKHNEQVKEMCANWEYFEQVKKNITEAAESELTKKPNEQKKDYISEGTWDKIKHRDKRAEEKTPEDEIKKLNKEINKEAKKGQETTPVEKVQRKPGRQK